MKNVVILNGETYVKVSKVFNRGLFTEIYYVNRRRKGGSDYSKGIPFMNLADAIEYQHTLESVLDMRCFITSESVYTRL